MHAFQNSGVLHTQNERTRQTMDGMFFIIALGAAAAGFVQGLSGFAFGMVAMSFWAWVLEPRDAAVLTVFGSLLGQVLSAITVRRGFALAKLLPFILGGLAGIPWVSCCCRTWTWPGSRPCWAACWCCGAR